MVRQGLTPLAGALGLERVVSVERVLLRHGAGAQIRPAERLRVALEELGATFIKLGQLLSTRADLLPAEYADELARLQDAAPPVPFEAIRDAVDGELDGGIDGSYESFEARPLAAGSVGQAHAAVLHDGTQVVVKVRRPGVVEQVEQDLEILHNLAARAKRRWPAAETYDVMGLAKEFAAGLRSQLDYLEEACNAERFARNLSAVPDVRVPRIFWELTTSRVITMERLGGMKVTDLPALDAAGVDRHALADRAARLVGRMVFKDGLFHGDPHPGNFFIEGTGRIGIIDFGIVGTLDEGLRQRLRTLLVALERGEPDRVASALIALHVSSGTVDREGLREDLRPLLARYARRSISTIDMRRAVSDLLDVVRAHRLHVPRDLALLLGTLGVEEGIVEKLDPGFSFFEALGPYVRADVLSQLAPSSLVRRFERIGLDAFEFAEEAPGQLRRALDALAGGGFEMHLRADELEQLMSRAERLGNRIARSILAAAALNVAGELVAARRRRAVRSE